MKYAMKAAAALLAALLVCLPVCAAGGQAGNMLVLGDSISTGYGLEDYYVDNPYKCASYANRLAKDLGLESGRTYVNRAVNGYTSAQLRALIPQLKATVEQSDLIIVSIGGNDLLHTLPQLAKELTGVATSDYAAALEALIYSDASQYANAVEKMTPVFSRVVSEFAENVKGSIDLLREYNPSAKIVFLAQYNPLSGVSKAGIAATLAASVIASLNAALSVAVSGREGVVIADVPSVIDGAAEARTNILAADIHPNAAGHGEIYLLLRELLNPDEAETSAEETTAEETTAEETTAEETTEEETTVEETEETSVPDGTGSDTGTDSSSATETRESIADMLGCRSSVGAFYAFATALCLAPAVLKRRKDR